MTLRRDPFLPRLSFAALGGAVLWGVSAFYAADAQAACVQTGSEVDCTGNDFNGFLSPQSLTVRVHPDAFIQNLITSDRVGLCPLSFPAIEAGASSSVLNEGIISTAGVCGFGIAVDRNSSVINRGTIRTSDLIAYEIIADDGGVVRNSGTISTEFQGSGGIFGGNSMRVVAEAGGTITTTGSGSSGITVGTLSSVTNNGRISTSGDASHGIDAGSGSAVMNSGTIMTSANNSIGVRLTGGDFTNSGIIRSILTGPAFALTPIVGVSIVGGTSNFTNTASGSVTATHIGVRLSGTQGASLSNNGRIEASPAIQYDGTTSANGGAIVLSGSVGVDIANAGTIIAYDGLPAIRSLAPQVTLRNMGAIVGDVILSGGNDTVVFSGTSTIDGAIDFGAGDDLVVFQRGGVLDRAITNVERLSMSGANPLVIARNLSVSQQINVLGGGGIVVNPGVRLTAAVTDNIGTIRGSGIIDGAIENSGVVAPGTAVEKGTLTVAGAFRQFAVGTLAIRISPDGTSDRLMVGGPATLAGTLALTYDVRPGGPLFQDGQRFDVLTPTGTALTRTGQFTLAAPQLAFVTAKLTTTTAGGVAVEIDRLSYSTAAATESQASAGRLLDRLQVSRSPALSSTIERLEVASPEVATGILASFAPEAAGGAQNLGLMALDRFNQSLRSRAPSRGEYGSFVWARGFSASGGSRGVMSKGDYDLRGAAAGLETNLGDVRLGVAAARIDADFARGSDGAAFDTSLVALTAHYGWDNVGVDASVAYGSGSPDMRRVRTLNGTLEPLASEASANLWSVSVDGTLATALGPATLTPHVGFAYQRAGLGAFDERQSLGVRTTRATAQSARARIGAGVAADVGRVRPYGDLSVSMELAQRQPHISATLIGVTDSAFDLFGDARRRIAVEAEAGLTVALTERLEGHVAGAMTANDLLAGRTLSAGLTYRW